MDQDLAPYWLTVAPIDPPKWCIPPTVYYWFNYRTNTLWRWSVVLAHWVPQAYRGGTSLAIQIKNITDIIGVPS